VRVLWRAFDDACGLLGPRTKGDAQHRERLRAEARLWLFSPEDEASRLGFFHMAGLGSPGPQEMERMLVEWGEMRREQG